MGMAFGLGGWGMRNGSRLVCKTVIGWENGDGNGLRWVCEDGGMGMAFYRSG